ncbi:sigma-70 family RNA polymerase sigma factor [Paractinoplanes atraurantiacus]|uniref:RNA polymerase sigma-70 factor, ECF subfamily n=1 Tax=Paractinoplanes atraurantiacus TaxID=1036182 RepID=A0A285J4L8_9ACTN|nr:sigma-70 family RNA polymerase sigma factor [Actinoplanes atraurantiacus]SNY55224.1 RNA polymerase sigma-70 factor, ECF subfamily [Actinoplanes atraurantiacus]
MGAPAAGSLTGAFEAERRGLLAHAYRMLGGHHEAEDMVQETYVRALRGWASFQERSSVRTWLYRIATNVCLTAIENRARPALVPVLEPFPSDPADLVTARESVRLAFVAGLQHLAPRQRAVLLLREVLTFSAAETGEALGMTVPAVKSALQRARARLAEVAPARDDVLDASSPRARELLAAYMAAWEASDADAFREVLRADAAIDPVGAPGSYAAGREACLAFAGPSMGVPGEWRMTATEANGQPAALAWFRGEPYGIAVLTVAEDGIVVVTLFAIDFRGGWETAARGVRHVDAQGVGVLGVSGAVEGVRGMV